MIVPHLFGFSLTKRKREKRERNALCKEISKSLKTSKFQSLLNCFSILSLSYLAHLTLTIRVSSWTFPNNRIQVKSYSRTTPEGALGDTLNFEPVGTRQHGSPHRDPPYQDKVHPRSSFCTTQEHRWMEWQWETGKIGTVIMSRCQPGWSVCSVHASAKSDDCWSGSGSFPRRLWRAERRTCWWEAESCRTLSQYRRCRSAESS